MIYETERFKDDNEIIIVNSKELVIACQKYCQRLCLKRSGTLQQEIIVLVELCGGPT